MEQMQHVRSRPRIPAVQCGTGAASRRLDRHLAVLGAPALSQVEVAEAVGLIRELTPRGLGTPASTTAPARPNRFSRTVLLAPLRRLKRSLFGSRSSR
ncbi:hypothetical protein [Streptacidiphilus jiangxiensis]|uniref:Uncharacterized protein n=1 Tax=Streptacidiphilus jiangxiensis TaxID=235985 RepID=A0A1H8AT99_STRJI|nr:hypothetical protein [Streptacidiphilus jiangxiensis]SEM73184.1 hypothetical protein SAMN05414137_14914 [Streptacidiphilus jiangxiensis]